MSFKTRVFFILLTAGLSHVLLLTAGYFGAYY